MKKGFTLIEMLVVIGMIAVLTAASMVGYTKFVKQAENAKNQELVSNVVTALTAIYQIDGAWPKRLVTGAMQTPPFLDENAALPLGKRGYLTLDYDSAANTLRGYDRFGVLTQDGVAILKRRGTKVQKTEVEGYLVCYAIDDDGDGIVDIDSLGVRVRATACAWCTGKKTKGQASVVKSWTAGQEVR